MAFKYGAGVQESSITTGTGTLTLAGAPTGFQTFSTGIGNGNTCLYRAESQDGGWEEGLGTIAAGTLARTTIYNSSNAGAAVNFATPVIVKNIANTSQLNGLLPQYYIGGLIPSWSSTTVLGIGAGRCKDSTNFIDIYLPSAFTKSTSAWAVGTGNGGKLSAAAIAANTTYHWYAIIKDSDGSVDIGFDTSPTAPTMPSGYTYFRRIFSVKTNGSSQWTTFNAVQTLAGAIMIKLDVPVRDVNLTNPTTALLTHTLSVVTGIKVGPIGIMTLVNGSNNMFGLMFTDGQTTSTTPSSSLYNFSCSSTNSINSNHQLLGQYLTNTSGQLQSKLSASGVADVQTIITEGWIDTRGSNS